MGNNIVCMLDEDAGCGVTDKGGSAYPTFPLEGLAAPAPPQLPGVVVVEPGCELFVVAVVI